MSGCRMGRVLELANLSIPFASSSPASLPPPARHTRPPPSQTIGVDVDDKSSRQIFLAVDKDGSGILGYSEFEQAWGTIQKLIIIATMEKMGLTKKNIMIAMAVVGTLLLSMFAFIFVGVSAFFGGGLVGSTVTSGMCASGGGGGDDKEEEPDPEAAGGAIEENS